MEKKIKKEKIMEEILGLDEYEIFNIALEGYVCGYRNGIAAYNIKTQEIEGFGLGGNESLHPADNKNLIYIYKIDQNVESENDSTEDFFLYIRESFKEDGFSESEKAFIEYQIEEKLKYDE